MADTPQIPVMIFCESSRYAVGFMTDGTPSRVPVDVPSDASPAQIAQRLASVIGRGRRVVVGLPSMACLVAAFRTDDLPRKNKRSAMLYRMEEHLPAAAEDLSADFLDHGAAALGVAVQIDAWGPQLGAIEAAGIPVAAVCPTALLALQSHQAQSHAPSNDSSDALLWQDGDRLELYFLAGERLEQWYVLPADAADVALVAAARAVRSPGRLRLVARGVDAAVLTQVGALPAVEVIDSDRSASADLSLAAVEWSKGIVGGRRRPLVDLLRDDDDAGIRGSRRTVAPIRVLVAVAVGCLCVAAGFLWRAGRYAAIADQFDAEKRSTFRQVFPGRDVPVGVASRLQSVEHELSGTLPPEGATGPAGPPALALLHDTLTHLPADVRCRWTELRFDPGAVSLEGEVLHHADAGVIAAALRRARSLESFVIDEPRTRQLDGGIVGFSISGAVRPPVHAEGGTP